MYWIFCLVFLIIGVLNIFLVHPVPGIFYLILSFLYSPLTHAALKKRHAYTIPPFIPIIAALIILWGTLAVSDLAQILGL